MTPAAGRGTVAHNRRSGMTDLVTAEMVEAYRRDGVVLVKGLWADRVEALRAGI